MRLIVFILIFPLIFCHPASLNAQERSITGQVSSVDGSALSYASVVLISLTDSSHIAYTTTNQSGQYRLAYSGSSEVLLQVRYMGYKPQEKRIDLTAAQTIDFILEESATILSNVTVNARSLGAIIRGDTITYNLGVYTDSTERVLRDILEKLPGLEVDDNGKVRAQGKDIKVLIDGKEFFVNQSQMATRNLTAQMVKSVALINNYNDIGMLSGSSAPQGITVLNVGIKEEYFGRVSGILTAGGGFIDKYSGKTNLFSFTGNLSIAALFDANNTGEMAFTLTDFSSFQQGVQRFRRSSIGSVTDVGSDLPMYSFTEDVAHKEGQTGAINLSYRHPNNKLKINSYVIANRQQQDGERITRRSSNTDPEGAPVSIDGLTEEGRFNFINSYLSADYQPSDHFFISNRAMLSGQDRHLNTLINGQFAMQYDTLTSNEKVKVFDFRNYLLSMYKTKNDNLLTLDGSYRYFNQPVERSLFSNTLFLGLPFSDATVADLRAIQQTKQQAHDLSGMVEYAYKLGAFYIKSQAGVSYLHIYNNAALFQLLHGSALPFEPQHDFVNTLNYQNFDLWAGLSLERNIGIVRLALGMDAHRVTIAINDENSNPLVRKNYWKALPNAQITFYLPKNNEIALSFNQIQEQRRIGSLNQSMVVGNYRSVIQGEITDQLLHPILSASVRYAYKNFHSGTVIALYSSYSRRYNPITSDYTYHSNYTKSLFVGSPDNNSVNSGFSFGQDLHFLPVHLKLTILHRQNWSYNYVNGVENEMSTNMFSANLTLMTFTKGIVNGELGGSYERRNIRSKLANRPNRIITYSPHTKFRVKVGKEWTLHSSLQHITYDANDTQRGITNLSAWVVYVPKKSHFEFELNANNILNFNKVEKIMSTYSQGYFTESIIRTLPGYLMAKVSYKI